MTDQKLKPCPKCETDEYLVVYKYDNGWQHVECDKCTYLGPGEGNRRQAIKSHNEAYLKRTAANLGAELSSEEQSPMEALGLGIGGRGVAEY